MFKTCKTDDVDAIMDTCTYKDAMGRTKILVCIPNFEIQGKFHQWLRNHISRRMEPEMKSMSVDLFCKMVSGDMASFSGQFGRLILDMMDIML